MATLRAITARIQDQISVRLGLAPVARTAAVRAMLAPRPGATVGYWLQLMMAAALATLGLALDSTAVVIGAMLIAPLMRPIVELAMGLATGSPSLAVRAGIRAVASIVAVIVAATAIAWLLPFHEVTKELIARTAPSLLDLAVAAACAVVGAYATMFSSSDMASTAAGTSIGISLVPPLCTVGYGISIGDWEMARGAALLFTANITGIITVAGIVFLVVGFGQVDVDAAELASEPAGIASRLGRNISKASRRLGVFSRLVLPLLLLAAIFVPLRRAVGELTRRSELRRELEDRLASTKLRVAQSAIELDAKGARVRVVIVGDPDAAKQLDRELRALLVRNGETEPRLSVWAIPDAVSVGALATRLDDLPPIVPARPVVRGLAEQTPAEVRALVARAWPVHGTGALVSAWLEPASPLRLHIVHLGGELGIAGRELLASAVSSAAALEVVEVALEPLEATPADGLAWAVHAAAVVVRAREVRGVSLCVTVPQRGPRPPVANADLVAIVRAALDSTLAGAADVTITEGAGWRIEPVLGACPAPDVSRPVPTSP